MNAIVNINPCWGIGSENQLLIHIRADMRRFRSMTVNNTVIFGRKTLDTFPNGDPLPKRSNIVLTRDPSFCRDGLTICHNLTELQSAIAGLDPDSVFVCGGEQIYRLLLPYCSKAYVTLTETDLKADRYFPNLNRLIDWSLTEVGEKQYENGVPFRFMTYVNQNVKPF